MIYDFEKLYTIIMIVVFMNSDKISINVILRNTVLSVLSISGSHYFYLHYIDKNINVESYKNLTEIIEFFSGSVVIKFIENKMISVMIYINVIYLLLTMVMSVIGLKLVKKVNEDYLSQL